MTIEECYESLGGNYDEVRNRMKTEERIYKFIQLFLKDNSYRQFVQHMTKGNYTEAFCAIHTLKGICQNMEFTKLLQSVEKMTEYLREGKTETAIGLLDCVSENYNQTITMLKKL